jgi:hypothetical protein
MPNPLRP